MRLALLLFKYFPYGGLQRDCLSLARELQDRGCHCRVYCLEWQGEPLDGVELRTVPVRALSNHRRYQRYVQWVHSDLAADPVDGVIGFNKVPGLDVYFAADPCFVEKAGERGWWYRRSARFRHFAAWERAVFGAGSNTRVLLISESQRDSFQRHYQTPPERMYLLPPGVAPARRAPEDAPQWRRAKRDALGVKEGELVLLSVGSGFITKGLDRTIQALADIREQQPSVEIRLLVAGQDKPRRFVRQARRLGVADGVHFLGGREDVTDLMLAADLLVHPARSEAAGIVLLESLVAGLPVVVSDVCGYAHYVKAARGGLVLPSPFSQEQLNRAIMRNIDGVFRADCRESALLYARLTDLYSMHSVGADLMVQFVRERMARDGV